MAELKPCPFCGGEAGVMRYHHIKGAYCFCTVCKVRMPNAMTREEAIEAWNRRTNDGQCS
jgi:Lar family restriction alleviation protein